MKNLYKNSTVGVFGARMDSDEGVIKSYKIYDMTCDTFDV